MAVVSLFVALEIEPRALCILGRHCTTELHPQTYFYFETVSC
jgi:uncharacterized membrane protein YfbV (UPF0208 family)